MASAIIISLYHADYAPSFYFSKIFLFNVLFAEIISWDLHFKKIILQKSLEIIC